MDNNTRIQIEDMKNYYFTNGTDMPEALEMAALKPNNKGYDTMPLSDRVHGWCDTHTVEYAIVDTLPLQFISQDHSYWSLAGGTKDPDFKDKNGTTYELKITQYGSTDFTPEQFFKHVGNSMHHADYCLLYDPAYDTLYLGARDYRKWREVKTNFSKNFSCPLMKWKVQHFTPMKEIPLWD